MGNFSSFDSPFMQFINRLADLIILNFLVVLSSLPVVTVGAATAALYDVAGRIDRQEGSVWTSFWRAFKHNFKQATIIWLILLTGGLVISFSLQFYLSSDAGGAGIALVIVGILCFLWLGSFAWAFPLQSRFVNSVINTILNSFCCTVVHPFRTAAMVGLNSLPWALFFTALPWFVRVVPLWVFLWFSLTAYVNTHIFKKPFSAFMSAGE